MKRNDKTKTKTFCIRLISAQPTSYSYWMDEENKTFSLN